MKPDNIRIVVDEDGIERPRILDFGVAKFIAGDLGEVTGGLKTKTGVVLGTRSTWRPSRSAARRSTVGPTCTRSAPCSTSC
jgi:hypothetical protein